MVRACGEADNPKTNAHPEARCADSRRTRPMRWSCPVCRLPRHRRRERPAVRANTGACVRVRARACVRQWRGRRMWWWWKRRQGVRALVCAGVCVCLVGGKPARHGRHTLQYIVVPKPESLLVLVLVRQLARRRRTLLRHHGHRSRTLRRGTVRAALCRRLRG